MFLLYVRCLRIYVNLPFYYVEIVMGSTETTDKPTGAEEIVWNLGDLYQGTDDPKFNEDLSTLAEKCADFRAKWKGTVKDLSNEQFLEMVKEYETIIERLGRLGSFVQLIWSTDTENPENGRNLQMVREASAHAAQYLVFLQIEIANLSEERLDELESWEGLSSRKHWIETVIEHKPYTLSEDVERVLSVKNLTSRMAWVRLHDELMNQRSFWLNDREYTQPEIMKLMQEPDRETRKAASEAISKGLKEGVRHHAYIFNTVVSDHAVNDSLRGHDSWVQSRNMANEASDESVQALIDSVKEEYHLVRRFYALKKRLLGLDTFEDYDRGAPIGGDQGFWTWDDARDLVLSAYSEFHPTAGEIARKFFDESWIHAPVRKGKNGGAYSSGTIPSAHPYVFLNYTGTNRDVQVMAHELGHGIHQYLSRQQGPLLMHTPLTIAETASVFGEILTFNKLYSAAENDEQRLVMLVTKLDDILSTVFRQIAFNRFEEGMHVARRTEGELTVDRLCEIWLETQTDQFGDAVNLSEGYRYWWSYISHFMHVPGYVYAYAFGELLVLALYEIYKQDSEEFPDKYIERLSSGGAKRPTDLLAPFGIDIEDPEFWKVGLGVIERLITEAERLADAQ